MMNDERDPRQDPQPTDASPADDAATESSTEPSSAPASDAGAESPAAPMGEEGAADASPPPAWPTADTTPTSDEPAMAEPTMAETTSDEPAAEPGAGEPTPPPAEPWPSPTAETRPSDASFEPTGSSGGWDRPTEAPTDTAPESGSAAPPEATEQEPPTDPWPTEPPAAGSGDADSWPNRAPERGDEPAWETSHPPSEAEAYAAPPPEPAASDDTAAMAAAAATPAHSVPAASDVGESTQCPRCGTENRPGLAFCRNCGQRLVAAGVATTVERPGTPEGTMACPRCGTHNRAGVAFCQNCGANLRAVAAPGYVPPAAEAEAPAAAPVVVADSGRAVLGPVVLFIGALGIVAGWLLPFPYGGTSLFDRAFGSGGYGASFWNGYPDVNGGIADQAYFGFAGPAPILAALLLLLAIGGVVRARPGMLQGLGLLIALLWAIGLAALFVVVEVVGNMGGPLTELLRALTPGGIIFFLASLIVLIGTLTRFARS